MITNATLLRIDRRTGAAADGTPIYTAGGTLALRCFQDEVTNSQKWTLGATIKDASAVVFVPKAELAAAGEVEPARDVKLLVAIDGADPAGILATALQVKNRELGAIAHWEIYVKPAT